MKKLYLVICTIFLIFNATFALNGRPFSPDNFLRVSDTIKNKTASKSNTKTTDTSAHKSGLFKTGIRIHLPSIIKSGRTPKASSDSKNTATPQADSYKTVSDVKVYPNPVDNEINLSYRVNKDSNVTIKIMDVLGNEITTLMSQKLPAGEQLNTFNISSRLGSGFYFIRLMVGNEVIVKRISVL